MEVNFYGVRGSYPISDRMYSKFGGATSCVTLTCGSRQIVIDAGTGIINYGQSLLVRPRTAIVLLFSHYHWDHIQGFPFFRPLFQRGWQISCFGAPAEPDGRTVEQVLRSQMTAPVFPIELDYAFADIDFTTITTNTRFSIDDGDGVAILITTARLQHPNAATGYRIDYRGKSVCYICDTEHTPGKDDVEILKLIDSADLVIYDTTFTEADFPRHIGWGHSTYKEGVRLCQLAKVARLALYHHNPEYDDSRMDEIAGTAQQLWSGCITSKQGMQLKL